MHCPNCGSPVEQGQPTCEECGADLRTQSDDPRPHEEQPRNGQGGQPQGGQGEQPRGQGGQPQGGQGGQPRGQGGQPQGGQGGQPRGQGGQPQGGQGGQPQQGGRPPGGQPPGGPQGGRGPEDGDQPDEGIDRRTLLAGGGVVAAVVAGGGLFVFLQGDDEDGSPDGSPDTPGRSFAEAPQISDGTHGPYELAEGENHNFAIDLESGDQLTVTASFTHAEGDLDLELYDSSELLARADSSTDDETLTREADTSETHYITVYGYEGATNSYELDVQVA